MTATTVAIGAGSMRTTDGFLFSRNAIGIGHGTHCCVWRLCCPY
jgi:hypothetical protein